jgi:hypothetical protein
MWKVYLLEFIITLIVSILWVIAIDKSKDIDRDDIEFP